MRKILYFVLLLVAMTSCGSGNSNSVATGIDSDSVVTDSILSIEGTWIQSVGDSIREFQLKEDNTAESKSMGNIRYISWSQSGDSVKIKVSKTLADTVVTDTLSYRILKLKADSLVLVKGENSFKYQRKR